MISCTVSYTWYHAWYCSMVLCCRIHDITNYISCKIIWCCEYFKFLWCYKKIMISYMILDMILIFQIKWWYLLTSKNLWHHCFVCYIICNIISMISHIWNCIWYTMISKRCTMISYKSMISLYCKVPDIGTCSFWHFLRFPKASLSFGKRTTSAKRESRSLGLIRLLRKKALLLLRTS